MKRFFLLLACLPTLLFGQTLEECQAAAERNYPLIRQYDLIGKTTDLNVSNILRGWIPQLSLNAQVSYQSDVVSWPDRIQAMFKQMGVEMKGLRRDQYRIGLDLNQVIYDGGVMDSRKRIARAEGEVQRAQAEISVYQIHQRVNEMYFALLMLEEQAQLNADLITLLTENEKRLNALYQGGSAAESDVQSVQAELLDATQAGTNIHSRKRALQLMLGLFCGIEVNHPVKPATRELTEMGERPELKLADAQIRLANAHERALNTGLTPRLSLFATGFYGYPGYNMFKDMLSHDWSLNGMVGARFTWNIGALYTRKNDRAKLQLQRDLAENGREIFLFNNRLEQIRQNEQTERYRQLLKDDEQLIALRTAIRQAAESKMANGVISVSDLIKEINRENAARVQQSIHQIELLKVQYENKYTTNN